MLLLNEQCNTVQSAPKVALGTMKNLYFLTVSLGLISGLDFVITSIRAKRSVFLQLHTFVSCCKFRVLGSSSPCLHLLLLFSSQTISDESFRQACAIRTLRVPPDTDVLVLLLRRYPALCRCAAFVTGVRENHQTIKLGPIGCTGSQKGNSLGRCSNCRGRGG